MFCFFIFRSVLASNWIQIQLSAFQPVESSINIKPLDAAAFRQPLKFLISSFIIYQHGCREYGIC